jgi:hypothetical protein
MKFNDIVQLITESDDDIEAGMDVADKITSIASKEVYATDGEDFYVMTVGEYIEKPNNYRYLGYSSLEKFLSDLSTGACLKTGIFDSNDGKPILYGVYAVGLDKMAMQELHSKIRRVIQHAGGPEGFNRILSTT